MCKCSSLLGRLPWKLDTLGSVWGFFVFCCVFLTWPASRLPATAAHRARRLLHGSGLQLLAVPQTKGKCCPLLPACSVAEIFFFTVLYSAVSNFQSLFSQLAALTTLSMQLLFLFLCVCIYICVSIYKIYITHLYVFICRCVMPA